LENKKSEKPKKRNKYTLEELVKEIIDENRHEAIDFGKPVGKEIF